MAKKIMRKLRLNEISAVDRPAQKGALAVIMKREAAGSVTKVGLYEIDGFDQLPAGVQAYLKRDFSDDKRKELAGSGAAMSDGSYPVENRADLENAIRAVGRAKNPAKAKAHIISRARALDATSMLPDDWRAGKSIGGDLVMEIVRLAPRAMPELMENIVKAEEIRDQIAKADDAKVRGDKLAEWDIAKNALVTSAWSIVDGASAGDVASLLRKNFSEYKDHVEKLLTPAAPAKQGDLSMKEIAKKLGLPETATEVEIIAAIEKNATALAKADTLAKMSGKHKAFMENDKAKMPSGGKDAFQAMSPADRDAHMASNPVGGDSGSEDDCIKVDGKAIRKADVGDAAFTILKAQQADIQKMRDEADVSTIAKRVAPLTFVIGKADETAAILHRVTVGRTTAKDAEVIEGILKSSNELLAKSDKLTKEMGGGSRTGEFSKAFDAINAKAIELQKADGKLSIEKARTKAREQNPELAKQEQEEAQAARKAA